MQREINLRVTEGVTEPQYRGTVFWFLAASTLTLWAVSGELVTVGLLFRDIRSGQSLPYATVVVMWALVVGAAALLAVYSWTSIRSIVKDQMDLAKHTRLTRQKRDALALALLPVAELEEADLEALPGEQRTAIQRMGGRVRVLRMTEEELLAVGEPEPRLPSWPVL